MTAKLLSLLPGLMYWIVATFSRSISLGAVIISLMLGVATMVGLLYGVRFKTLAAVQAFTIEALEAERDNQATIAARVEQQNTDLKSTIAAQASKIEQLEQLPNMTIVIESLTNVFRDSDTHAQMRHEETILAISKIGINQHGA